MPWELLLAVSAGFAAYAVTALTVKVTKKKMIAEAAAEEASAAQTIQESAIALLAPLRAQIEENGEKIDSQALQISAQSREISRLRKTIEAMEKTEVYLMAQIHDKDKRIQHLEEVCRAAGINGEDLPPVNGR